MNISNNFNNISFQKQLMAKCSVLKNDEPIPCKIYRLEGNKREDRDYFRKLDDEYIWQENHFLKSINQSIKKIAQGNDEFYQKADVYVLEDNRGLCLGYCQTDEVKQGEMCLDYLETAPKYVNGKKRKKSSVRYIGETLIAFLALKAKQKSCDLLAVWAPSDSAKKFYKNNCKFQTGNKPYELCLKNNKYDYIINKNKMHTLFGVSLINK